MNTQKIMTVDILYGLLGNMVGASLTSSCAISNSICASSAMMRLCRLKNLSQSVFIVKSTRA